MHAFAYQTPKTLATLRRLERLAWMLDAAWRIPLTNKRIGLDAVLDWIPGVGQVAAQGMALASDEGRLALNASCADRSSRSGSMIVSTIR